MAGKLQPSPRRPAPPSAFPAPVRPRASLAGSPVKPHCCKSCSSTRVRTGSGLGPAGSACRKRGEPPAIPRGPAPSLPRAPSAVRRRQRAQRARVPTPQKHAGAEDAGLSPLL